MHAYLLPKSFRKAACFGGAPHTVEMFLRPSSLFPPTGVALPEGRCAKYQRTPFQEALVRSFVCPVQVRASCA